MTGRRTIFRILIVAASLCYVVHAVRGDNVIIREPTPRNGGGGGGNIGVLTDTAIEFHVQGVGGRNHKNNKYNDSNDDPSEPGFYGGGGGGNKNKGRRSGKHKGSGGGGSGSGGGKNNKMNAAQAMKIGKMIMQNGKMVNKIAGKAGFVKQFLK